MFSHISNYVCFSWIEMHIDWLPISTNMIRKVILNSRHLDHYVIDSNLRSKWTVSFRGKTTVHFPYICSYHYTHRSVPILQNSYVGWYQWYQWNSFLQNKSQAIFSRQILCWIFVFTHFIISLYRSMTLLLGRTWFHYHITIGSTLIWI